MYDATFEDYSKDATELDFWVFDHVKALFKAAETDEELKSQLSHNRIIFFLHLLGIDTTGHAFRPYSQGLLRNIQVVDRGVQEISAMIQNYYGDDRTAYVFTADHGMSDWGSHGDGHPDNTRTPLIAWGSGIARPESNASRNEKASGHDDGFSSDWQLNHIARHDVNQADITTLMAYLLDLDFPVNSVGKLPLAFLNATSEQKARALYTNAKQISEMYRSKEQQKMTEVIRYKPCQNLSQEKRNTVRHRLDFIESLLQKEDFDLAIQESTELIDASLQGLRYLQTYAWLFLRTLVTLGYLGWVAFTFTESIGVSGSDMTDIRRQRAWYSASFPSAFVGLCSVLLIQKSPLSHYAYSVFPFFFWERALPLLVLQLKSPTKAWSVIWQKKRSLVLSIVTYVVLLELLVQSYYHREVYTVAYVAIAFWPLTYGTRFLKHNKFITITWSLACITMSGFTLLPARKTESLAVVSIGGVLILVVGILCLAVDTGVLMPLVPAHLKRYAARNRDSSKAILFLQVALVAACLLITRSAIVSLSKKQGLPLRTQIAGWLVFVASLTVPVVYALRSSRNYFRRHAIIFLALGPTFIILTISYEGLFYLAISTTLLAWVELECSIKSYSPDIQPMPAVTDRAFMTDQLSTIYSEATTPNTQSDPNPRSITNFGWSRSDPNGKKKLPSSGLLQTSDLRICIFFLYFLHSTFFSTGNIASISSFSLDAVYRLLPVFDPFSQAALLLFKIFAPFILVSANLKFLTRRLELPRGSLFVAVTGLSDYLTLRFFWAVKDEGSWLEIGETISMFIISAPLCVFVAGLEALSEVMVEGIDVHF